MSNNTTAGSFPLLHFSFSLFIFIFKSGQFCSFFMLESLFNAGTQIVRKIIITFLANRFFIPRSKLTTFKQFFTSITEEVFIVVRFFEKFLTISNNRLETMSTSISEKLSIMRSAIRQPFVSKKIFPIKVHYKYDM